MTALFSHQRGVTAVLCHSTSSRSSINTPSSNKVCPGAGSVIMARRAYPPFSVLMVGVFQFSSTDICLCLKSEYPPPLRVSPLSISTRTKIQPLLTSFSHFSFDPIELCMHRFIRKSCPTTASFLSVFR